MHAYLQVEKEAKAAIERERQNMARLKEEEYQPIPENQKIYDRLYAEYLRLHDYFGRGENNVMKRLRQIRNEVS